MESKIDKAVISAVVSAIGIILLWAGAKFKDVPEDVSTLKVQRVEDVKRVDKLADKVDEVKSKEDEILALLRARQGRN